MNMVTECAETRYTVLRSLMFLFENNRDFYTEDQGFFVVLGALKSAKSIIGRQINIGR